MATRSRGVDTRFIQTPKVIVTSVQRVLDAHPAHELAVQFSCLSPDEVRTLIDCAIKIEQARTGDVLSPTEYAERFADLDLGERPSDVQRRFAGLDIDGTGNLGQD